jgi:hypothetical protein
MVVYGCLWFMAVEVSERTDLYSVLTFFELILCMCCIDPYACERVACPESTEDGNVN